MSEDLAAIRRRIDSEPDYIYLKKFNDSLDEVIARFPDGVPDRLAAQALLMSEAEYEDTYEQIVLKLRGMMGETP